MLKPVFTGTPLREVMRRLPSAIVCLVGILVNALPAYGQPVFITYNFEATLVQSFGTLPEGTRVLGSFTYTSPAPLSGGMPGLWDNVINITLSAGGETLNYAGTNFVDSLFITNDDASGYDRMEIQNWASIPTGSLGGDSAVSFFLEFVDERGTVFDDLSLPGADLQSDSFTTGTFFLYGSNGQYAQGVDVVLRRAGMRNVGMEVVHPKINPASNARIAFALLSEQGFDAVRDIELTTIRFGASGSEVSVTGCLPVGVDVNHDGLLDLVCAAIASRTGLAADDDEVHIQGQTRAGVLFAGRAPVSILGARR